MKSAVGSILVAACMSAACDVQKDAQNEAQTNVAQKKTLSRLLASLTADRIGFDPSSVPTDELYTCVTKRAERELYSSESLFKRLDEYFRLLDQAAAPVDRSQTEGAVLVAVDYIRACKPTALRAPNDLVRPVPSQN